MYSYYINFIIIMEDTDMSQNKRIIIALIIIVVLSGAILTVDSFRRGGMLYRNFISKKFDAGYIPIYRGPHELGRFSIAETSKLTKIAFTDKTEKKLQEGWPLSDVIRMYVDKNSLTPGTRVMVASSARNKAVSLAWNDIAKKKNMIILAISKQGTLKLVSMMKGFDTRDQWIQNVDRIEVSH